MKKNIIIVQILLLIFSISGYSQDTEPSNNKYTYVKTSVTPIRDAEIDTINNLVYCASFEISWNILKEEIIKEKIVLDEQVNWVNYLNVQTKNNSINPENIYTLIDFGKNINLTSVKSELKEKFKIEFNQNIELADTDIFSFVYLNKEIEFYSELSDYFGKERLMFNDTNGVDFFGLKFGWANPVYKENLRIYDYKNENDFIFQIGAKNGNDEIFLAKITPEETLEQTYTAVINRVNKSKVDLLGDDEQVRIPYINLNIEKEYREVEGAKIKNEDFNNYSIGKAIQIIDFKLNEQGISLTSIAENVMYECDLENEPRKLIFNKPFLIILKEKDKDEPYFLMWINNSELVNLNLWEGDKYFFKWMNEMFMTLCWLSFTRFCLLQI